MNLLSNAVKFTEKGHIVLVMSAVPADSTPKLNPPKELFETDPSLQRFMLNVSVSFSFSQMIARRKTLIAPLVTSPLTVNNIQGHCITEENTTR